MHPDAFSSLYLSYYRLNLRACAATTLPSFLGSTLRGAFGHALKQTVCVMDHRDCKRCLVAERCLYPYLFETPVPPGLSLLQGQQQAPRPFVLVPPIDESPEVENEREPTCSSDWAKRIEQPARDNYASRANAITSDLAIQRRYIAQGGELSFGLLLIGRAIEYLPYVVYAMSNLAKRGLGASRARFELSQVAALDGQGKEQVIYTQQSQQIVPHGSATKSLNELVCARLDQLSAQDTLRLRFLTPTRIRVWGELQTGMSFELLVRNLLRRVSLLIAVHGNSPMAADYRTLIARARDVQTTSARLRWWDWGRYSNRQQTKMKLGGFVGEIEYSGAALGEFLPLIVAGELLNVGAGTSFGLGKYQVLS